MLDKSLVNYFGMDGYQIEKIFDSHCKKSRIISGQFSPYIHYLIGKRTYKTKNSIYNPKL